jgi:hypothetical protein
MRLQLALYKGPPRDDWAHTLSHYGIRVWTRSPWSHAELVIDGVCWSSSARDGGVRPKVIDLASGRWDVVELYLPADQAAYALAWFQLHDGDKYDYLNIGRFVLPILGHDRDRWVCFEAIGAALQLAAPHKLTANDLAAWAALFSMPPGAGPEDL